jgi:hypothetical protein
VAGVQASQHSTSQGARVATPGAAVTVPRLQLACNTEQAMGGGDGGRHVQGSVGHDADDQVLFDAELASYISDTDYTDLRSADFEVCWGCTTTQTHELGVRGAHIQKPIAGAQ